MFHPAMDALLTHLGVTLRCDGETLIERAFDALDKIGQGGTATVFAHPTAPDLVVRVTDYPDGWFAYADRARAMDVPSPHAPVVHDIVHADGVWIAVAERLEECRDDIGETLLLNLARRVVADVTAGCENANDVAAMEREQPGFMDCVNELLFGAQDLAYENFMRRGETLVVNDPVRAMTPAEEKILAARFDIMRRAPASDRIQAAPRDVDFNLAM